MITVKIVLQDDAPDNKHNIDMNLSFSDLYDVLHDDFSVFKKSVATIIQVKRTMALETV